MKNKSKENPTCTGRSVKQTLRFLLCIALLLAVPKAGAQDVWDGKPDKSWYTDDSQEDDGVYHIKTAAELAGMAELVNGGYDFCDKTVMLDADIVLNETDGWENWGYKAPDGLKEWTPIGTYGSPFSGIFDGQGHTVKGVYIMRKNYAGLFGYLDGGTIQNVGVVESNISGSRIGGIVGHNRGDINSCYYTGEVVGPISGGIIGMREEGDISNCYYSDNIGQGVVVNLMVIP